MVVGPEDARAFARYWDKEQFPFIGLPDPTHAVADLYGQQVKWLKLGRLPALVIVAKDGTIVYEHFGDSMRDIVPNAEVLAVLDDLNQRAG